jgi:hypothetical protein
MQKTKIIILSTAAAKDLEQLLPSIPILGKELNNFVHDIRAQLQLALMTPGEKTQLTIEIYPVASEN